MKTSLVLLCLAGVLVAALAQEERAGGQEKKYDGYFQYANVPGPYEYEFGYNRGNPSHYTSRYEQSKDSRFRTKVKWGDKNEGYGEQYWEYNHADYAAPAAYPAPAPGYSAPGYSAPEYPSSPGYAAASKPTGDYVPAPVKV